MLTSFSSADLTLQFAGYGRAGPQASLPQSRNTLESTAGCSQPSTVNALSAMMQSKCKLETSVCSGLQNGTWAQPPGGAPAAVAAHDMNTSPEDELRPRAKGRKRCRMLSDACRDLTGGYSDDL